MKKLIPTPIGTIDNRIVYAVGIGQVGRFPALYISFSQNYKENQVVTLDSYLRMSQIQSMELDDEKIKALMKSNQESR